MFSCKFILFPVSGQLKMLLEKRESSMFIPKKKKENNLFPLTCNK